MEAEVLAKAAPLRPRQGVDLLTPSGRPAVDHGGCRID
jgi:hypothetical protein